MQIKCKHGKGEVQKSYDTVNHALISKSKGHICTECKPQGSVLVPLIFILCVNDLPQHVER